MLSYRYSRWDGAQDFLDPTADDVMQGMADDLLSHGDINRALRHLLQRGMQGRSGQSLPGIQNLMERLRSRRQEMLDRNNMSSFMDQIQERLDHILQSEREGIEGRLDQARRDAQAKDEQNDEQSDAQSDGQSRQPTAQSGDQASDRQSSGQRQAGQTQAGQGQQRQNVNQQMLQALEKVAEKKKDYLDNLPPDPGGRIKELTNYDFMDEEARQEFQELLAMLKQNVMDSQFNNISQSLQNMTPGQKQRLRDMMKALNEMLRQKREGLEPDFQDFMDKFGDFFPEQPQSLEELLDQLQQRMAQAQALMQSLSPESRQQIEDMLRDLLQGDPLEQELQQLAANMQALRPSSLQDYDFQGDEPVSLTEAMSLMELLQELDQLENQLERAQAGAPLENLSEEQLRRLLGEEAEAILERLKQLEKLLKEAGYVVDKGNKLELTPKALRQIGQKALQDIFLLLKKDRFGQHPLDKGGAGGDRADETKVYEFGAPFHLHLEQTLMNALKREGRGSPVHLTADDFEVYKTEQLTQCSTVLMLDLSWSMPLRGKFLAAKKVALALESLIRTMFPRDNLYLLGFSDYARELKSEALPYISWNDYYYGTNMQHGFQLSRKLLSKHKSGTRQIFMITDGEPTAHIEGGHAYFEYPPNPLTLQLTLLEAKRCAKENVVINTFMLERTPHLMKFMDELAKVNRGRVFYTGPEKLGQYLLVDYISNKTRRVA